MIRALAALAMIVLAGCNLDIDQSTCGSVPSACGNRCLTQVESFQYEDCCDSVTCNCNPSTGEWEQHYCDPPRYDAAPADASLLDAGPDAWAGWDF